MNLNIHKIKFWWICSAAADALNFENLSAVGTIEGDLNVWRLLACKDWRMDKMLRHLDAMLVVMDIRNSFIIAGDAY